MLLSVGYYSFRFFFLPKICHYIFCLLIIWLCKKVRQIIIQHLNTNVWIIGSIGIFNIIDDETNASAHIMYVNNNNTFIDGQWYNNKLIKVTGSYNSRDDDLRGWILIFKCLVKLLRVMKFNKDCRNCIFHFK